MIVKRALRIAALVLTAGWAVYGLAWFLMAPKVVRVLCRSGLQIVRLDAEDAERRGEWLSAAHHYAHLIEYDGNLAVGCESPELNQKVSLPA